MKAIIAAVAIAALIALSGMTVATERMSISTDRQVYSAGETVTITLVNQCRSPLELQGFWVEDPAGQCIYSPVLLPFAQYINPGEEYDYYWDQSDYEGNQVAEGFYSVCINEGSARIEIVQPSIDISTSKAVYDMGEEVEIIVTNTGEVAAVAPSGITVTNDRGETVFTENTLAFLRILQPGEAVEYIWDQRDDSGKPVSTGTYTITLGGEDMTVTILDEAAHAPTHSAFRPACGQVFDFDSVKPGLPPKRPNSIC